MPFAMTAITRPPMMASTTRPLPPNRLVPPMTAAPTAYSRVCEPPVCAVAPLSRLAMRMPATAAMRRADDEAQQPDQLDVDARAPCSLRVAADGVHVPAERRADQQERQDQEQEQDDRHDDRHALDGRDRRVAAALLAQVVRRQPQRDGQDDDLGGPHRHARRSAARWRAGAGSDAASPGRSRPPRPRTSSSRATPASCCCSGRAGPGCGSAMSPPSPMICSTTPCRPRNAARVTTNEGIPRRATSRPMHRPMTAPVASARQDGQPPRLVVVGGDDAHHDRRRACRVAGGQVDLAEQQHEDQAHRDDDDAPRSG